MLECCRTAFGKLKVKIKVVANLPKADDKAQDGIRQWKLSWKFVAVMQLQCYVHRLRDAFAELDKLITTFCERSFSTLCVDVVKSYVLRTSIGNDRLHDLLYISCDGVQTVKLNLDDVVSHFSRKYPTCKI